MARALLLSLMVAATATATEPAALVRVGETAVPVSEVTAALRACGAREKPPSAADCLRGPHAFNWLLDAAARAQGLLDRPPIQSKRADLYAQALLARFARDAVEPTAEELAAARLTHASEFERPQRIRIFRILVETAERARELRARLGPDATPTAFRALAREASLDRATHERGGDLGFVAPDGSTDVPEVSAEPALYAAAARLSDGEISAEPVAEGNHFALLWRRGTLPATRVDTAEALARLRQSLRRERADQASAGLLRDLKARELKEWHPERLERLRGAGRLFPLH